MFTVKKVPETIRIDFEEGCSVLIAPDERVEPKYRDFWINRIGYCEAFHMFGLCVENDEMAIEIAVTNAMRYIKILMEDDAED